jgi:hypothetical protein
LGLDNLFYYREIAGKLPVGSFRWTPLMCKEADLANRSTSTSPAFHLDPASRANWRYRLAWQAVENRVPSWSRWSLYRSVLAH